MNLVFSDLFRPWRTTQTWWTLVHLISGAATASVLFTLVFTPLVTAVSIAIVIPAAAALTWLTLVIARRLASFDRSRFAALLGVELVGRPPRPAAGPTRWNQFWAAMGDAERWREVAWAVLHFPVAIAFSTVAASLWSACAVLTTLPIWIWALPGNRAEPGWFRIDAGAESLAAGAVGLVGLALIAPWLTVAMGNADAAMARWLLGRNREAELDAKVGELETSRAAAVDSAEAERRRIERDLHDGAQQRLIAVAMDLGLARGQLETNPERAKELVASAHDDVKAAMKELRDLVRGIHPVILEDRGLDAALSAVVARCGVPVSLRINVAERPAPSIESAAYFIVSETLVNVDRHAEATRATVEIARVADRLTIGVTDDGVGGADPDGSADGTGLAGLAERVSALGGWMRIISPVGGPTTIFVELPCES